MKHARQVIREAVATMLAGIGPTVYRSRAYPLAQLPAISVFCNDESSESENDAIGTPRRYSRSVDLTVEVMVEATTDADDLADDYAAQAEAAIAGDLTLSGTATDTELIRTGFELIGEAEKIIVRAQLGFRVWYRTTAADPENAIIN